MSEDFQNYITSYTPIPKIFQSFETNAPIDRCADCDNYLLEDGTRYIIQKAFRGSEVILEFAWCLKCHAQIMEVYSKETRNRFWDFFLDRVNMEERGKKLLDEHWTTLEPWISSCMTCDTKRDKCSSYILIGDCDGPDLLYQYMPYLICETCELALNDCMSAKSRDIWDDWIGENLDVPPAIRQDIKNGKIVIV